MYGHTLIMNEERIPKTVRNVKGPKRKPEIRMETGLGKVWYRIKEDEEL
jgi:hypothetical protein